MTAIPEGQRSPRTARGALLLMLTAMEKSGTIANYKCSDIALATVTLPDGTRINLTAHRIDDERMQRKPSPKPRLAGKR